MNKVIFFYLVSIFMLANGSLFTWLFQGTPLNIWRQLIWILGLIIFFKYIRSLESIKLKKVVNVHLYIFIFIVFQALLTFAIYNFNFIRLLYAFWIYFSGLPFLLLPFLWREKLFSAQKFYDIFVCLGIFLTIGLIFDYLSGGFFTRMFLISVSSSLKDMLNDGRYCFLSEAPTTFGVYYCFCLFCTLYRLYICNDTKSKLMYLVIILSYIIGSWLTGSRQIVFALVLTFFVSVFYYIFCVRDKKSYLVVGILLLLFAIPYVKFFLYSEESYQNRYSVELLKKDAK